MSEQYDLTKFDKVMADVVAIQEQGNFLPDCATKEGYEASKRFVLDVTTPARKALNDAHKETKKPFLEACQFLDTKKKELMPLLESIEAPHKEAYKAIDQAKKEERERFEADLEAKVQGIVSMQNLPIGVASEQVSERIYECGEIDTSHGFYHRATDAETARQESLDILNDALVQVLKAEAEAIEAAKVAEQQRIERERLEAEQAELRRQQEEFEAKQAEAKRVEEERNAKSNAERQAAEEAERAKERQAAQLAHEKEMEEMRAKQEAEAKAKLEALEKEREAKQKKLRAGRTKNRNTAAKALMDSLEIDKETAVCVVNLIASGEVPFITANF